MTFIITKHQVTVFGLADRFGNPARTTAGEIFKTTTLARAEEARDYLNQSRAGGRRLRGSHWLKSTFGCEAAVVTL